jgi:biopolymer transport protein ExbD
MMQPGIKVNLPKTEVSDSEDTSNIEALISREGEVYMEGDKIEGERLEEELRKQVKKNPGKSVVIKGDEKVEYENVIKFMDKAKKAGATKFALAVEMKEKR